MGGSAKKIGGILRFHLQDREDRGIPPTRLSPADADFIMKMEGPHPGQWH